MIKYILTLSLLWTSFLGLSQITPSGQTPSDINNPVIWEGSISKLEANNFNLALSALIEKDWHVYCQHTYNDDGIGPIALSLKFLNEGANFKTLGETLESKTYTEYSDVWEFDETFFKDNAELTQKIELLNPDLEFIKAELFYQVCIDVCLNEERYVVFNLRDNLVEFIDNYDAFEAYTLSGDTKEVTSSSKEVSENIKVNQSKKQKNKGLWTIFFIAFLSGFAALLTPCVFPMIPLTVSFFTKQSKDKASGYRNAFLYAFFIIIIYVLLGTMVTAIFGADALNALSTNVWFNIIFFLLLVVFAASFLGAFEIALPQSWANKVDRQADKGGIAGIFFMALALAIVSFSCTGPIVGTLLVEAASKGGIAPIIGMLGFSMAMAIPFALFALFPGWLNSLPKSGGWLNTVKVFLGFLELALAFKFLSKADLVTQSHLLEREVFLAIWITVFGALALYLFGKIKLPHDSDNSRISVGRLSVGLVVLSFTIYLIPGLWGAPLKVISGFPPPMNYSESPYGVGFMKKGASEATALPENAHFGPHDIASFLDFDEGMAYAKAQNKPVLVDFTGWGCENCRKMEERIWAEPQILEILKRDIVLISLYVDEKTKLPENKQYTSETTGKRIRTVGNKWSDFQIEHYRANAQPYYVLMNHQSENLIDPIGYTPNVDAYQAWLEEGVDNF